MNTIKNGFQAVGIMHGFQSDPWRNDPSKFNHRILLANPFLDGNGFQQTEVMSIDIAHDDVHRVQQLANELKGKRVILPCRCDAKKGGKNGAWLSRFLPKGSNIMALQEKSHA
ncbi:MAG: hypothetical protein ACI9YH_004205 [Colwellia sp.]|jgi:hypothetical protein